MDVRAEEGSFESLVLIQGSSASLCIARNRISTSVFLVIPSMVYKSSVASVDYLCEPQTQFFFHNPPKTPLQYPGPSPSIGALPRLDDYTYKTSLSKATISLIIYIRDSTPHKNNQHRNPRNVSASSHEESG